MTATKRAATLRIVGDAPSPRAPQPPANRGRLWYDHQIADEFLGGLPKIKDKVRWVREHFPKETRIQIGRDSAWYADDIMAFLSMQRGKIA